MSALDSAHSHLFVSNDNSSLQHDYQICARRVENIPRSERENSYDFLPAQQRLLGTRSIHQNILQ